MLIDEYDKPMLDVIGRDLEEKNRNKLKDFMEHLKLQMPFFVLYY